MEMFKMNINFKFISAFMLFVLFLHAVHSEDNGSLMVVDNDETNVEIDEENTTPITYEPFYPTTEWQEIKPDQAIPKGLHVRINLQTGLKEAKLMENPEKETDPNYLKRLKDFTKDATFEKRKKFRNIEQLKKEFHDSNLSIKSDYEILKDLIAKLKTKSLKDDEKVNIYNDLEYYLHQFDNGQDFVKMKGIDIILPDLNSTNEELRAMAAFVLGSAMQSNPQVQIAALESGLLPIFLRSIAFDLSYVARGHSLYALSCFIRHFPLAQQKFLEHGGLVLLSKLFETKLNQPKDYKLQIKVITLLTDLMEEQVLTSQHSTQIDTNLDEKKKQYERVQLKVNLVEQGWCNYIPRPLIVSEHDGREKVMEAMITLVRNCRSEFTKSNSILKTIHLEYKQLSSEEITDNAESSDTYFTHLKEMVEVLMRELINNKDEL